MGSQVTYELDGELACRCRRGFEPFGGLKSAFRAANDGVAASSAIKFDSGFESSSSQSGMEALAGDLEIVCVAFDLLFYKDQVGHFASFTPVLGQSSSLLKAAFCKSPASSVRRDWTQDSGVLPALGKNKGSSDTE